MPQTTLRDLWDDWACGLLLLASRVAGSRTWIPPSARILCLAEAYASMRSSTPYRDALSHEHAAEQVRSGMGTFFDEGLAGAFLQALH